MEKCDIRDLPIKEEIYDGEGSSIYGIGDGKLVKIAKPIVTSTCAMLGSSYERKILDTRAHAVKEIISPIEAVYQQGSCVGYTMKRISGLDLNHYDEHFTLKDRSNLHEYAILFRKIEEVVRKAHKLGIVMPDLCTCDNIVLNRDGSLSFIDYDGMQMGEQDVSVCLSTSLGDPMKYLAAPKYSSGMFRFTKELDKTSLTILMFLLVFNLDLNKIGDFNPMTGKFVTIQDIFELLNLKDPVFMNKVAANISLDCRGTFLADDLDRIASEYDMSTFEVGNDFYIKKLSRK